jgi:hypothetical protein
MRDYTHHFEIEDVLQQFADALNDIIVKRYNKDRAVGDQIHVNFVYAPKTRTLHEIVNLAQHHKMPIISIYQGGIRRNPNRVFNKIAGSWWSDTLSSNPSAANWINLLQPVPVDITVNVSILARFQADIDQILTNFIPYTDPYFVISWKWPDLIPFSDFEIRSHVKWNENVSFQYPTEITKEQPYWTMADTSFTIEGWIFKNKPPDGKPIYVIDHSFTAVSALDSYHTMKSAEDMFNTDYYSDYTVISARPQSMLIEPYFGYLGTTVTADKEFTIIGKMMDYVESVYLSGNNWNMFNYSTTGDFITSGPTSIDKFSTSAFYASAVYPPFTGVEMLTGKWNTVDKNHLQFSFTPLTTGTFDVILLNRAGYGILSRDCVRPTLNPFRAGTPEHIEYTEYQYPCVSGVQIRSV